MENTWQRSERKVLRDCTLKLEILHVKFKIMEILNTLFQGRSMSLANFQRNAKNINEYYMKHGNNVEVRYLSCAET